MSSAREGEQVLVSAPTRKARRSGFLSTRSSNTSSVGPSAGLPNTAESHQAVEPRRDWGPLMSAD